MGGVIPFWVRNAAQAASIRKMTANAKAETAFEAPSFRNAIRKRRCLVPAILAVEDEKTWLSSGLTEREISALLRPYETSAMDAVVLEKDYLRQA
jgi:putative SOS response-associated peptidase YedK